MKTGNALFLIFVFYAITACNNDPKDKTLSSKIVSNGKVPHMKFTETEHDFGDVTQGEIVSHTFDFVNDGEGDLIISEAQTTCGCTVPEYPKDPVLPGEHGQILVKFNTEGKQGQNHKVVTLITNTNPNKNDISITANVILPKPQ